MATLPQARDLATNYVETDRPDTVYGDHYHLFAENDSFLIRYLADKDGRGLFPQKYDRQSTLKKYWADCEHEHWDKVEWDYGNGEEGFPLWPCNFQGEGKYVACVDLMREHAPGIALTRALEFGDKTGLTLARSSVEGKKRDERDTDDTRDLRLAIAYVCMGEVPPSILVLKALSNPLPWPVDDAIVDAFKRSVEAMGKRVMAATFTIADSVTFRM